MASWVIVSKATLVLKRPPEIGGILGGLDPAEFPKLR